MTSSERPLERIARTNNQKKETNQMEPEQPTQDRKKIPQREMPDSPTKKKILGVRQSTPLTPATPRASQSLIRIRLGVSRRNKFSSNCRDFPVNLWTRK
jgi:hypothetical protein